MTGYVDRSSTLAMRVLDFRQIVLFETITASQMRLGSEIEAMDFSFLTSIKFWRGV